VRSRIPRRCRRSVSNTGLTVGRGRVWRPGVECVLERTGIFGATQDPLAFRVVCAGGLEGARFEDETGGGGWGVEGEDGAEGRDGCCVLYAGLLLAVDRGWVWLM
jgi:hypothetical protein